MLGATIYIFKSLCTGVYQAGGDDTHPVLGDSSVRPGQKKKIITGIEKSMFGQ